MKRLISLDNLQDFAADFVFEYAKPGNAVFIYGDLGAGKTSFVREVIKALIPDIGKVQSPTFNLLQIYNTENFPIYHYDLYRLKSKEELEELGIHEALTTAFTLVEWPDLIEDLKPQNQLIKVKIDFTGLDDKREFLVILP
jgi:tRNA threonylcarbamoyladenosine biosynthesis protein TsaE